MLRSESTVEVNFDETALVAHGDGGGVIRADSRPPQARMACAYVLPRLSRDEIG